MTKYVATFADGTTITRDSERAYGVAWRATWDGNSRTGFSSSADKVKAYVPTLAWPATRFPSKTEQVEVAAAQAKALADSCYRVEIVQTVAA